MLITFLSGNFHPYIVLLVLVMISDQRSVMICSSFPRSLIFANTFFFYSYLYQAGDIEDSFCHLRCGTQNHALYARAVGRQRFRTARAVGANDEAIGPDRVRPSSSDHVEFRRVPSRPESSWPGRYVVPNLRSRSRRTNDICIIKKRGSEMTFRCSV